MRQTSATPPAQFSQWTAAGHALVLPALVDQRTMQQVACVWRDPNVGMLCASRLAHVPDLCENLQNAALHLSLPIYKPL